MAQFETMLPELQSRCRRLAQRYNANQRQDAADDALASMYLNHASAVKRGKALSTQDLGWAATFRLRYRSDVIRARAADSRNSISSIDAVSDDKHHPLHNRLGYVLTTSERENPFDLVRVRLDWSAFARTQPRRTQRILLALARGEKKAAIAKDLNITPARISQILSTIQVRVLEFHGADVPI